MNTLHTILSADDPIALREKVMHINYAFFPKIPLKFIEVSVVIKREEGGGYVTEIINR